MEAYALKKETLYQSLRREILSGKYAPESRLPKELDFCRQLGVAKVTLRSALEKLEADGLVARVPGKGTFISAQQKSNLILVCIAKKSGIERPQNYILPGIEAAASVLGFRTELCFIDYLRNLKQEKAVEVLRRKNLYGALLVTSAVQEDDPEVLILRALGIPVLIVHGYYQDRHAGFGLMYVNMRAAWMEGVRYLVGKGHRRIGIISQHPDEVRGWKYDLLPELYRSFGLDFDPSLFAAAEFEPDAIRAAAQMILDAENPPTALFCFSDFYAIEVMSYFHLKGIRIPEDIAVMGYCGYPGATLLDPPLSTIDLNYRSIGRAAVELLASSGSWFQIPETPLPLVTIPYAVVERDSTKIIRNDPDLASKYFTDCKLKEAK